MREELRLMEIIEQYLSGNMTPQEKEHFEKRLQQHPHLRQKVEEQKALQEGLDRHAIRQQVKKAYKAYQLQNFLKFLLPSLLVAGIAIAGITLNSESAAELWQDTPDEPIESIQNSEDGFDYKIKMNADSSTVFESEEGVLLVIPEGAFLDETGQPVKGEIELKYAEAISPEAIIEKGLSTVSDSNLLETGGMFNLAAFQDGKPLKINPDKGVYVEVPTNNPQSDMHLYDGIQQKDGSINWKNPKPLANFLVPVDITTLDFYPPAFLDSVASLGLDVTNKQLTDSLYYSLASLTESGNKPHFSHTRAKYYRIDPVDYTQTQTSFDIENMTADSAAEYNPVKLTFLPLTRLSANEYLIKIDVSVEKGWSMYFHKETDRGPIPIELTLHNENTSKTAGLKFSKKPTKKYDNNFQMEFEYLEGNFQITQKVRSTSKTTIDYSLDFMVGDHERVIPQQTISTSIPIPNNFQLSPLSIRSIWDNKFNNSNLATREFEKRMHTIHQTCNEEVLKTYIQHLDQPLWYADSLAASKTGGELNAAFTTFKNERAGKVKGGERFAKALEQYYKKQKQALTKALRQTLAKTQKEREQEAKALQKHQSKDSQRKEKNFQKEFQLNWKKVRKELGIKNARIRRGPSYRTVITTPGWKNIDRQVFEATQNRESATFSYKGKTSSLTYEPLEVEVKNSPDETNLKVYLLPKKLYSFQRMHKKGHLYTEKLNMDFKYDVLVVQFEHNNVHYFEQKNISPGHITVELTQTMTKEKWKKKLRRKYPRQMAKDLKAEQEYMELIQKRTARIKQEKEQLRIQEVLKYGAFPCLSKATDLSYITNEEASFEK